MSIVMMVKITRIASWSLLIASTGRAAFLVKLLSQYHSSYVLGETWSSVYYCCLYDELLGSLAELPLLE